MTYDAQLTSPLFSIPPETRLNIYSFLIPNNTLTIDLCTTRRPDASSTFFGVRHRSPISTFRQQLNALHEITRINGLHLLLVCRRTQAEVLSLFAETTVRFHCPECFKTFLPNVARGLGVGVEWMKHVEIEFDLTKTRQMGRGQRLTAALAKTMAREVMQSCQKLGWYWYGPLYLTGKEEWGYAPLRKQKEKEKRDGDALSMMSASVSVGGGGGGGVVNQWPVLGAPAAATADGRDQVPTKWLVTGKFDI